MLLKVTGAHDEVLEGGRGYRDHILFSAALGTALRQAELLAAAPLPPHDMSDLRR